MLPDSKTCSGHISSSACFSTPPAIHNSAGRSTPVLPHFRTISGPASAIELPPQPTPPVALVISGMNDVLNSQGYTQAAWWYRIPVQAWNLMALIAFACNLLIGYGARRSHPFLLLIVPLAVSLSFFLIADIDSPIGGLIQVRPQNLMSLDASLTPH